MEITIKLSYEELEAENNHLKSEIIKINNDKIVAVRYKDEMQGQNKLLRDLFEDLMMKIVDKL